MEKLICKFYFPLSLLPEHILSSLQKPNVMPPAASIEIAVGSPASARTINCGATAINFSIVMSSFFCFVFYMYTYIIDLNLEKKGA